MPRLSLEEALLILEGKGPILEAALDASRILREHRIEGGIVGGVAVGLYGRLRATDDVDVYVAKDAQRFAELLETHGYCASETAREFVKVHACVHLHTLVQIGRRRLQYTDINGIRTVSLADLINIKLRSGRDNILRARDLADVVDLMRGNRLSGEFTGLIESDLRPEFRRILQAIADEPAGT